MSQTSDRSTSKKHRHPRYDYRARSHVSAHANGETRPSGAIPEHPLIPRNRAELIGTPGPLRELIEHVRSVGSFAYDSEFIGELSYHPKLCLIQVATSQRVALIDTLVDLDLSEFWELIADVQVEKVVHAGQQDLEPVFRQINKPPARVFDTQVAAGFIGLSYPVGLSKLVKELVGVQLGKAFTFTHWDQRPLTDVQLRYAADDVRYLPALRQAIGARLDDRGHAAWAAEECAGLCDESLYRSDPAQSYLRVRGANSLSPKNAAVLRELVIWREAAARRHDSPPRSYLKDEILIDMARNPVTTAEGLDRVRGLPRPVEEEEGQNIIEATEQGLALPEADWPAMAQNEETPGERFSADALWAVVQTWCHGHGVDPNLTCSRQEISRFYREMRKAEGAMESRLLRGWRGELLGHMLQQFLQGQRTMKLRWQEGTMRAQAE